MQTSLFLLFGFLFAVSLGMVIIPRILVISHKKRLYDVPDARKVHTMLVPRLGGLSFFPVILMSMFLVIGFRLYFWDMDTSSLSFNMLYEYLFLFVGMTLLYLVGVCDDLVGVGYRYKFAVQIAAALLLVLSGNWFDSFGGLFGIYSVPVWVGVPFTVFIVVYITNAINLIDGIDGLASGLCCIALSVLSVIFFLRGQYVYALLAICTLGILMPFWCYNVFGNANRGHKLFMGDAGSLTLGYVISFLIIHMSVTNEVSPTLSNPYMVIAFSTVLLPLLDVIRVVLHRLREHKNPFLPDKNHFHHKLLRTGMRVRVVMVCIIAISAFFILLNSSLAWRVDITYLFFLNLFCWSILHVGLNGLIKRNRERKESEQLR
ncbi:MraY family glycosyltransferase [Parabacteroides distasonis]|uniref:Undecaprenyl/decaprenyl-phosphate alpha-N-acetylglucosaminyl 1-phosphate transferase n=1 Tax=Parabacteroides distasonis TaxID=823 RepID=A0AAP2Q9S6_PARDI|nr:MraY family glycosyltransferase [Parabacteroides distasonis]MBV4298965.1 undecaprenyl/decaprenyl-phosphate alpha-N-acetylglucosaminyl 1-phosphate transferase [Parabacteroides distasonis]MBV4306465.1 undecaprenyl/decaprenyl-phosphate alpha-N-acetylglucosaminyl 1-phosphate transferase [Parabacteroides distasonis]MBV4317520.1 undecaprenyl/decaprenyl-phosphate alpha-N-acetylglucosaminyl 1-phosphate transferase [Parabacteroides distasonis]MBV4322214.1 undecaprenyl/decaprenyl-phosphate alpha-N-ace